MLGQEKGLFAYYFILVPSAVPVTLDLLMVYFRLVYFYFLGLTEIGFFKVHLPDSMPSAVNTGKTTIYFDQCLYNIMHKWRFNIDPANMAS